MDITGKQIALVFIGTLILNSLMLHVEIKNVQELIWFVFQREVICFLIC